MFNLISIFISVERSIEITGNNGQTVNKNRKGALKN